MSPVGVAVTQDGPADPDFGLAPSKVWPSLLLQNTEVSLALLSVPKTTPPGARVRSGPVDPALIALGPIPAARRTRDQVKPPFVERHRLVSPPAGSVEAGPPMTDPALIEVMTGEDAANTIDPSWAVWTAGSAPSLWVST